MFAAVLLKTAAPTSSVQETSPLTSLRMSKLERPARDESPASGEDEPRDSDRRRSANNTSSRPRSETGGGGGGDGRKLTCTDCGKQFSRQQNLQDHMATHTGDKAFECNVCNKKFAQRRNRDTHMRIHSGERPFKCRVRDCQKTFSRRDNLAAHERSHSGETPFECNVCHKKFSQRGFRDMHLRKHGSAGKQRK